MKKLAILLIASTFAIACPFLTACDGGEEEEILAPDNNENAGNGNQDKVDNTAEIVKRNISATAKRDNDYGWVISIKSNLEKALPGKSIIYGVESGYDSYKYYEHFTFNHAYFQEKDSNGNMSVHYPVFIEAEYPTEALYCRQYKAVKNKEASGNTLSSDERDFLKEVVPILKKADKIDVKSHYCGRLYAQINNKRYFYYYFGIQPY